MKKVVIVGAGALGSRTAKLFSSENLRIAVIDRDVVLPENLSNQLYEEEDIGMPKAIALKKYFRIVPRAVELNKDTEELLKADLVIDCVDNLATRRIISSYCAKNKIPWVHGAVIKDQYVVMPVIKGGFGAVFSGKNDGLSCETAGLLPESAERTARLQYELGMKILSGKKVVQEMIRGLVGGKEERYKLPEVMTEEESDDHPPIKLCGRDLWQFRKDFKINDDYKRISDCWLFKDGRVLVKAKTQEQAEKKLKELERKIKPFQTSH